MGGADAEVMALPPQTGNLRKVQTVVEMAVEQLLRMKLMRQEVRSRGRLRSPDLRLRLLCWMDHFQQGPPRVESRWE